MGALDLAAKLRRMPFEPFRIVTSDGVNYDVRHPEMVIVGLTSAHIGFPASGGQPVAERIDIVALEYIVRLEQLSQPTPAKPDGA